VIPGPLIGRAAPSRYPSCCTRDVWRSTTATTATARRMPPSICWRPCCGSGPIALFGELCSAGEAWAYLRGREVGHPGGITTIHAGSAERTVAILATMMRGDLAGAIMSRHRPPGPLPTPTLPPNARQWRPPPAAPRAVVVRRRNGSVVRREFHCHRSRRSSKPRSGSDAVPNVKGPMWQKLPASAGTGSLVSPTPTPGCSSPSPQISSSLSSIDDPAAA
jgi:hypothetical protein